MLSTLEHMKGVYTGSVEGLTGSIIAFATSKMVSCGEGRPLSYTRITQRLPKGARELENYMPTIYQMVARRKDYVRLVFDPVLGGHLVEFLDDKTLHVVSDKQWRVLYGFFLRRRENIQILPLP